jgi:hypothetical protein
MSRFCEHCNKKLVSITIFFSLALQPPWALASAFQFHDHFLQTVGLLWRVISSSQSLYLNTEQHKHRKNTYTHQTSMPCVRFELTIQPSERAKTVHALDLSATVTGVSITTTTQNLRRNTWKLNTYTITFNKSFYKPLKKRFYFGFVEYNFEAPDDCSPNRMWRCTTW